MLDLIATAAANSAARRADAAELIADDVSGVLARFRDFASGSMFSSNVSAAKVVDWDSASEVLDTRRWLIAQAAGNIAAGLAAFALQQGSWLVRREAFENLWEQGSCFVYGAVNAGGMGTEGRFGPFCIVLSDPEAHLPSVLAVFPGDSADRYTTVSGAVDEAAAEREATSWADRAVLAVVRCSPEALTADPHNWPDVVCRADRYLEVVIVAHLPITVLAEVRLRTGLIDRLDELQSRRFLGEPLEPDEENEVRAYSVLQAWRHSHGTSIVAVA